MIKDKSIKKKKLLITGGAGFIGGAVIREALKSNKYSIVNIDKLTYAANLHSLDSISENKDYCFEQVDICNEEAVKGIFLKHQPNAIMHLAAESHVDKSIDSSYDFIQTNIVGTYILLEQARNYFNNLDGLNKKQFIFHHVSTDEVYGDLNQEKLPSKEDAPYAPSSPYAASKASSDHLVRAWLRTYKLPSLITNCTNNYGPFHFPEKLIPHIILNALNGKRLPIYGDGLQIRDWIFVEDHARALLKVLTKGKIGETYNIGGSNEKKNIDVVKAICDLLEELAPKKPKGIKNYHDLITFVDDRPGHDIRYALDSSKIIDDLGWSPKETFDSGLRKTVLWYIQNEDWWKKVLSGAYRLERIGKYGN